MSGRLRIAVAGAGWWATANHLPVLAADPRVELTGVCRLGAAQLKQVQDTFGIPYASESFDAMMAEAPMDALVVTSPHALHAEQAMAAIGAGKHVLVEKPLAMTGDEARAVERAAAEKGVVTLVPYGWNFKPFFARAKALVDQGGIGRIRHVSAVMASPIGDLMSGSDMAGTEDAMFRPDPVMWSDAETGGYGYGQLVHLLGALFYLVDLQPRRVGAMTNTGQSRADLFDALAVTFDDGATAAISGAAGVPHGKPFQVDIRLYGDDGMLLIDVERERVALSRHDGADVSLDIAAGEGAYECIEPVRRFVSLCLGEDVENPADASIGRKAIEVVDAMHRSARTGTIQEIRREKA